MLIGQIHRNSDLFIFGWQMFVLNCPASVKAESDPVRINCNVLINLDKKIFTDTVTTTQMNRCFILPIYCYFLQFKWHLHGRLYLTGSNRLKGPCSDPQSHPSSLHLEKRYKFRMFSPWMIYWREKGPNFQEISEQGPLKQYFKICS